MRAWPTTASQQPLTQVTKVWDSCQPSRKANERGPHSPLLNEALHKALPGQAARLYALGDPLGRLLPLLGVPAP